MKTIKFRAWNKNTKKMLDLQALSPLATEIEGLFLPRSEDIELMQFTGLLDKNGKEIYEGDIVRGTIRFPSYKAGEIETGEIEWTHDSKECAFRLTQRSGNSSESYSGLQQFEEMKILGNIYENPELIK